MARRERVEAAVGDAVGVTEVVAVDRVVVDGDPAAVVCARSADADLLVVGSRDRSGFTRPLLGSVSNAWAHPSRCPIAIVPAPRRDPDGLTGS